MSKLAESTLVQDETDERSPVFASDSVPRYYQIESLLREKIFSGRLAPGEQVATEGELAREYGVSRVTVRQALVALKRDGLILRRAGRGTFVAPGEAPARALRVEGSLDDLISMGVTTSVKLIERAAAKATLEQARQLELAPGAPVVRSVRLRFHQDAPFSYIVTVLPKEVADRIDGDAWARGSILKVLTDTLQIPVCDADQTVRAALADANLARHLRTRIGAPLLWVSRVVKDRDGRPVEAVQTYYRSDIYSFRVHLVRSDCREGGNEEWSVKRDKAQRSSGERSARRGQAGVTD
jgi:GntR family transcriptional regulator